MDQYFTDYEVYNDVGVVFKWGNCFSRTKNTNINEIQDSIKSETAKTLGVAKDKIRFRQFNKI